MEWLAPTYLKALARFLRLFEYGKTGPGATIYIITFYTGSKPTGSETYRGAIDMAQAIAMAAVQKGSADRVEVRDLNKHLLFHYPRTFRA